MKKLALALIGIILCGVLTGCVSKDGGIGKYAHERNQSIVKTVDKLRNH